MIEKILITGGAGFVGSNLAIKLKMGNPEYEIICFDNLKRRGSELSLERFKEHGIEFIHGDIRSEHDLDEVESFDLMIECSAEPSVMAGTDSSPKYLLETNLAGTINCLELCRKRKSKIIFLSTSRVYPIEEINNFNFEESETRLNIEEKNDYVSEDGITEELPLRIDKSRSLYGMTKLSSEMLMQEYGEYYGLDFVINRCGVITGPWQMGKIDQGVFVLWVARHFWKQNLSYIGFGGTGKQVRDFIHIDDLYDLVQIQINDFSKFNRELFNIGGGKDNSVSLRELTGICEDVVGNKIYISSDLETRKGDIKWFIMDSKKVRDLCGWEPKKNAKQTICDIHNWIKENEKSLKPILLG